MKWNLRWAAARRDIWRPSDLLKAFEDVGFTPSLSKVAALWGSEAEPVADASGAEQEQRAAGAGGQPGGPARPAPRHGGSRRSLPPN